VDIFAGTMFCRMKVHYGSQSSVQMKDSTRFPSFQSWSRPGFVWREIFKHNTLKEEEVEVEVASMHTCFPLPPPCYLNRQGYIHMCT